MHRTRGYRKWLQIVTVVALLSTTAGCDPTLQATVEDGIISVSTAFFGALLQAALGLATESATTDTTTGTNTGTNTNGTVLLIRDVPEPVFV